MVMPSISEAQARARLERMLAWEEYPPLSEAEVNDLLEQSKTVDAYGIDPTQDAWNPSWNLKRGAVEGWKWKAGKVASKYDYSSDVNSLSRDQLYQHCIAMSDSYKTSSGSLIVSGVTAAYDPVIGNLNGGV